jgi:hypothetical protein
MYALTTPNPQASVNFGTTVAAGDVSGDGKADLVVGVAGETVGGNGTQGRAYVFSGADGTLLRTLNTPKAQPATDFGFSVAVGNVSGGTTPDIIVGSIGETVDGNSFQGRTYAFSGADGSLQLVLDTPIPQAFAFFGYAVAAGDVDSDGKADVVVGSYGEHVGANTFQGQAYVFAGGAAADTDGDHCSDPWESLLAPPTNPNDPWDFFSVPVPALFAAPNPLIVFADNSVGAGDGQAVFGYFKKGAKTGSTQYEQDLNGNGIKDGLEYDRSVVGPGQSGPPDGMVTATDAQLAFAQFKLGYTC